MSGINYTQAALGASPGLRGAKPTTNRNKLLSMRTEPVWTANCVGFTEMAAPTFERLSSEEMEDVIRATPDVSMTC